ncbi:MAG: hypothetical protein H0W97_00360 [Actinobacteria bacterium]|nr:hypothetical protein [Actinomycetota bacterium]
MMVRKGPDPIQRLSSAAALSILGGMTYATCAEQTMSVVVLAVKLKECVHRCLREEGPEHTAASR